MPTWDAGQYLKFAGPRTQPSIDLVARVTCAPVERVIDLGCGPGNSTVLLKQRWPEAEVIGLDSSPQMLATARRDYPDIEFIEADLADWQADAAFDVVFTNAALQWISDHEKLLPRLVAAVKTGGMFAAQMPHNQDQSAHRLMRELAASGPWAAKLKGYRGLQPVGMPAQYYDLLRPLVATLELWETEYIHIMETPAAIADWLQGTGLRPILERLEAAEQAAFLDQYIGLLTEAFPAQVDGRVLFPFRRLFILAEL